MVSIDPYWVIVMISVSYGAFNAAVWVIYYSYYNDLLYYFDKLGFHNIYKLIYNRIRGLVYRDLIRIIFDDLEKALQKRDIKDIGVKIVEGTWKPPEELDDAIRDYDSRMNALRLFDRIYEEAIDRERRAKRHFQALGSILSIMLTTYALAVIKDPIDALAPVAFLAAVLGALLMYPSRDYRLYYTKILNILKKIYNKRKQVEDHESIRFIDYILGEIEGVE